METQLDIKNLVGEAIEFRVTFLGPLVKSGEKHTFNFHIVMDFGEMNVVTQDGLAEKLHSVLMINRSYQALNFILEDLDTKYISPILLKTQLRLLQDSVVTKIENCKSKITFNFSSNNVLKSSGNFDEKNQRNLRDAIGIVVNNANVQLHNGLFQVTLMDSSGEAIQVMIPPAKWKTTDFDLFSVVAIRNADLKLDAGVIYLCCHNMETLIWCNPSIPEFDDQITWLHTNWNQVWRHLITELEQTPWFAMNWRSVWEDLLNKISNS